ncbi:MAG: EAL domain-containing protein [Pseudomonadota bacterium]|nr:MAG: EAL domain-containing protein [Pseudomonadota bacterium]
MAEKKILRLLIVDDSPDDAEASVQAIRKNGYMLKQSRVQDLTGMQAALDKGNWDAIISEFSLPHFGAQMAHDLMRSANLDLPFVVVTRQIKDDDVLRIMRLGIHDVVVKGQLARLTPALERELKAAEGRRALAEASRTVKEMEHKHHAVIEGSRDAICYCQDGMHVDANKAYLELFGYEQLSDLEGIPVLNLIDKSDHPRFKDLLRKGAKLTEPEAQEFVGLKQDGTRLHVEIGASAIQLEGENAVQLAAVDVSKRKAVESKLQFLNQHDPLTGLYNRHHFIQEVTKMVEMVRRAAARATILYIDLEQLKQINDTLGYAAGDRLLIKVARLFRERLGENVLLARFGGDEFAALLVNKSSHELQDISDALHKALKDTSFTEGGKTYHCHCTLGVTAIDEHAESAQKIMLKAYQASQRTRPAPERAAPPESAPTIAAAPMPERAAAPPTAVPTPAPVASAASDDWSARIENALKKDGFQLTYQPVINLHGEAAELFEVLVRMVADDESLITAGQFMPAAEASGLSMAIDRWVVRQAIVALGELHREGRAASFFINMAPSAFTDADLVPLIIQGVRAVGIKPEHLIFEVNESDLAQQPEKAKTFVWAVTKIGCRFAIDNFGRAVDTLTYLRDLPIEFVKLDGSLIRNLADPIDQTTLKAAVDVAKAIDKKVVAKSVEAAENLASLWNLGIDYVQGNYFQATDEDANYEPAGETTLSEVSAPQWATNTRARSR